MAYKREKRTPKKKKILKKKPITMSVTSHIDTTVAYRSRGLLKKNIVFDKESNDAAIDSLTSQNPLSSIALVSRGIGELIEVRKKKNAQFQREVIEHIMSGRIHFPDETKRIVIKSTDSDFHYGAKRVMQLCCYDREDGTGELITTLYYKPHEMKAENVAFGKKSIFAKFGLPTLRIQDLGGFGVVDDALIRDEGLTHENVIYIKKCLTDMGKVMALSELMGIGDLHVENIVPTKTGITIIDGEFAFNPDIMTGKNSSNLTNTGGKSVLVAGEIIPMTVGGFYSTLERLGLSSDIGAENRIIEKIYFDCLIDGYEDVTQKMGVINFEEYYKSINSVRITPMGTGEFAQLLVEFWDAHGKASQQYDEAKKQGIAMRTIEEMRHPIESIITYLVNKGYCHDVSSVHKRKLRKAMIACFSSGSIPRFSFSPKMNIVSIDNTVITNKTPYTWKRIMQIYQDKMSHMPITRLAIMTHIQQTYKVDYHRPQMVHQVVSKKQWSNKDIFVIAGALGISAVAFILLLRYIL